MDSNLNITPEAQQGVEQAQQLAAMADTYVIDSDLVYQEADSDLSNIVRRKKELIETRLSFTRPLDEQKRRLMDFFDVPIKALEQAEAGLKRRLIAYMNERDKARREAEAKAQEAARKERERLEKRAQAAADKGKTEVADALQQAAATVQAPVRVAAKPEGTKSTVKKTYAAEVTDLAALVKAVAAGTVPIQALKADTTFLNQQARAMKDALAYPGVKVVAKQSMATRR